MASTDEATDLGARSHYYADGTSATPAESKVHAARVFARTGTRSTVHPHRHGEACPAVGLLCVSWPPGSAAEPAAVQIAQPSDGVPPGPTAPDPATRAVDAADVARTAQRAAVVTGDGLFAPGDGYVPDPPAVRPAWCTFLTDGVPMGDACGADAVCEVLPPTSGEWAPRCGPHSYGFHGGRRRPIGGAQ